MSKVLQYCILWVVSLSVLNSSIDVIDITNILPYKDVLSGVEAYNKIESITEYVLSEATHHKKSLPDQKDGNSGPKLKKTGSFVFSIPFINKKKKDLIYLTMHRRPFISNSQLYLPAGFTSIFSPPPNMA